MTHPKDIKISQREQFALLNDPDFLNQVVTRYLQQFLEAEPYQRTDDRRGYRNGYKPRILKTRVGRIELSIPQDREGRFLSELFSRFQRSEKAPILALQEAYLQGVSTRKVTKITEQLCGTSFSKSQVSDLCQDLDADIFVLYRFENKKIRIKSKKNIYNSTIRGYYGRDSSCR